jgi:hypothetical protein
MSEVLALIPARGGSKSIPRKNIRPFGGHPLIAYSIAAGRAAATVTRVIVSTDAGGTDYDDLQSLVHLFAYADRAKLLAMGVPPLMIIESEHGTRSQAQEAGDTGRLTFEPIAREFATGVLVDQIVRPTIIYNFGEQADGYGEFPVRRQVDEAQMVTILEGLGRTGVFDGMTEPFYRRTQEKFPWLPEWEEVERSGRVEVPAGVR